MTTQTPPAGAFRRGQAALTAVGPVALAFLASQHHAIHMAILSLGVGTAGMSFMAMYPDIRRGMLVVSLLAAGVAAYQMTQSWRPRWMRVGHALSVMMTLLLIGWSVAEFGL